MDTGHWTVDSGHRARHLNGLGSLLQQIADEGLGLVWLGGIVVDFELTIRFGQVDLTGYSVGLWKIFDWLTVCGS